MNKGQLMEMLVNNAKEYINDSEESIKRNSHMNEVSKSETINRIHSEAVITDFLNFVGTKQGLDLGMYTSDLKQ